MAEKKQRQIISVTVMPDYVWSLYPSFLLIILSLMSVAVFPFSDAYFNSATWIKNNNKQTTKKTKSQTETFPFSLLPFFFL